MYGVSIYAVLEGTFTDRTSSVAAPPLTVAMDVKVDRA